MGFKMSTDDIKKLINEYFDDEMKKEEEVFLFTTLSQDEEAREYFKKMNLLKTSLDEVKEDFPLELEERIYYSLDDKVQKEKSFFNFRNIFAMASYALAVILLVISIVLFFRVEEYKKDMDNAVNVISAKSETIELLLQNTLPAAEVKAKFPNEIIIREN